MPAVSSRRFCGRILRGHAAWAALPLVATWIFFGPPFASAHPNARFYRGDVVVSTSWDGIIRLTGTVVIFPGVTVTVDPGTEILVQPGPDTNIVVRGRFLVRGLPGKPVLFDTAGGCSEGPWGGVVFESGSSGILENIKVRCSGRGIIGELGEVFRTGVVLERER
jgi:hypothetical protein